MQNRRWLACGMAGVLAVVAACVVFGRYFLRHRSSVLERPTGADQQANRVRFDEDLTSEMRRLPLSTETGDGPSPRLLDVASSLGLRFTFYPDMVPERYFLPENMGGGAGWLDYDGDGRLDLFLTNGCRLPLNESDGEHSQKLFRQSASGQFEEIEDAAGVDLRLYGQGCTVGDIDSDGFPDIVVTAFGHVTALANRGDGTFSPDLDHVRIDDSGWSTSAALGDVNRDGSLDLYIAHYAVVSLDEIPVCLYETDRGKVRGYCGPGSYVAEPHSLWLNSQDGTFRKYDLSGDAVPKQLGKGLGVIIADLNGDHWPEIYVANDMDANYLFHNLGADEEGMLRLQEVGMRAGAAVSSDGKPEASMGVAAADFDADQDLDIFITHYYLEKNTYYENLGDLSFMDRSTFTGLAVPSLPYLGFGTVPIDYELDGWQDLFVANGHVLGSQVKPFAMRSQIFRNGGKARFTEVTNRAGPYFFDERVSRGAALADFDNDGDEDLVTVHINDRPVSLLRNDTQRTGKPLGLELVGRQSSRSSIGAQVTVRSGDRKWMRAVVGGGSYLSANDTRILVGLTKDVVTATVEVRWPSGIIETWSNLKPEHYWRLVEGTAEHPPRLVQSL